MLFGEIDRGRMTSMLYIAATDKKARKPPFSRELANTTSGETTSAN